MGQFTLGEILEVEVAWDQQGMGALEVVAGDITSRSSKFSYKLFKGVGVNSVDQTLTCEAVIFKSSVSDPRPAADSDCPNQGNDSFFLYSAPVCNNEDCA